VSGARTQVGIVEWARRVRGARDLELALSDTLGGWIPRVQSAGPKLLLARHARHLAWHADLWDGLVPVLHDHPTGSEAGSGIAESGLREAAAALGAAVEARAVYDDVLPELVATYRSWSGDATPIAERPLMRVLDLVLRDIDFDAQEGHDLFSRS
jgi:hypothetical protein